MRKILITGANKGIGLETARQLAQLGNHIYLGARNPESGQAAVKTLHDEGLPNVEFIEIDVTDIQSIKQAAGKITALDVLINNAGIPGDQPQQYANCDIELVRKVFETNFFGAIQTTQQFIPVLKKSELPVIINVSSEVGSLTMHSSPDRNQNWAYYSVYGSSKTALNAFTVILAKEFKGTAFKVNSVTPGYTATDLNQFKGLKTVEEGAMPIVRLAMIEQDGPTGKFFKDNGEVAW